MAKKYELVTIMFSGIVDFTHYCNQSTEPMEIVELLNETYTKFDNLADKNVEVFKVYILDVISEEAACPVVRAL